MASKNSLAWEKPPQHWLAFTFFSDFPYRGIPGTPNNTERFANYHLQIWMFFKAEKKLGSHVVSTLDLLLCPLEHGKSRLAHCGRTRPGSLSTPSLPVPSHVSQCYRLNATTESPHTCTLSKHTGSTHNCLSSRKGACLYHQVRKGGVKYNKKSNNSNYPILLNFYF